MWHKGLKLFLSSFLSTEVAECQVNWAKRPAAYQPAAQLHVNAIFSDP